MTFEQQVKSVSADVENLAVALADRGAGPKGAWRP